VTGIADDRRTPRPVSGFTLMELLVTVMVIAVVVSVLGMGTSGAGTYGLDMAELQISDAIQRCQALARSNRTAFGVVFDLQNDRFAIVDELGTVSIDPLTKKDYIVDFVRPGQPHNIDITSADFGMAGTSLLLDPQGVPLFGGFVVLTRQGNRRTLQVDGATGLLTRL